MNVRLLEGVEEGGREERGGHLTRSEGERRAREEERPDGRGEQGVLLITSDELKMNILTSRSDVGLEGWRELGNWTAWCSIYTVADSGSTLARFSSGLGQEQCVQRCGSPV